MASDQPPDDSPAGQGEHIIQQGDCLDKIAKEHGLRWETIWEHPSNAALRDKRDSAFVLLPGDRLHIPERQMRQEAAATEQHHRFRRNGVPSKLRLCLRRFGEPRSKAPFRLDVDGTLHEGKTNDEGVLEVAIPPDAQEGQLYLDDGLEPAEYTLDLGHLDPPDTTAGVQRRLQNLGYGCEASGELDEATRAALRAFQEEEDLPVTGEPDAETRQALAKSHSS